MSRYKCFYCGDTGLFISAGNNNLPCTRCRSVEHCSPSKLLTGVPKQHNMQVKVGKPFAMFGLKGFQVVVNELFLSPVSNEGVY